MYIVQLPAYTYFSVYKTKIPDLSSFNKASTTLNSRSTSFIKRAIIVYF